MICCSRPHPVHPSASSILPCSIPSASPALFHCLKTLRHRGGFCRVHFWAWKETWVLGWTGSCRMEFLARFDMSEFCSFAESAIQTKALQSAAAASPKDSPHPLQGLSQLPKHSHLLSFCSSQLAQIILPGSIFLVCSAGFSRGNGATVVLWRESCGEVAESDKSQRLVLSPFQELLCSWAGAGTRKPEMPWCRLEDQKVSPPELMGQKLFVLNPWKISWIWWELSCWFPPSKS